MYKFLITIITVTFLLSGCGGSSTEAPVLNPPPVINYVDVGIEGYQINNQELKSLANGDIDVINDNSWVFTGFTNDLCIDNPASRCNKADIMVLDDYKNNDVKWPFEFELVEYNREFPPKYIIGWQDWRYRTELDSIGRHPITTIKVKHLDGRPYLTHCENSWQWDYTFTDDDEDHSLHQENDCHGKYFIEIGVSVNVEFYINPEGASLVVNDIVVSDEKYKTKSEFSDHKNMFGMYWDVDYNNKNEPDKALVVRIDNLKRLVNP